MLPSFDISDLPWKIIIFISIFFAIRTYFRGPQFKNSQKYVKNIVITGGSSGIGLELVREFAQRGANIIIGCNRVDKGKQNILKFLKSYNINANNVKIKRLCLDDFESVKEFCIDVLQEWEKVDLLINNAGVMMHPSVYTSDNLEYNFQVNYLSHFYITLTILPLLKVANGQIINVSCIAHRIASFNFFPYITQKSDNIISTITKKDQKDKFDARKAYSFSKLAVMLFTQRLAQKLEENGINIRVNCCNPGICLTSAHKYMPYWNNTILYMCFLPFLWFFMKTPKDGAQTILYCVMDESNKNVSGKYFSDCKIEEPGLNAKDPINAQTLWETSLALCNLKDINM